LPYLNSQSLASRAPSTHGPDFGSSGLSGELRAAVALKAGFFQRWAGLNDFEERHRASDHGLRSLMGVLELCDVRGAFPFAVRAGDFREEERGLTHPDTNFVQGSLAEDESRNPALLKAKRSHAQ
jgi:hypothetical protein